MTAKNIMNPEIRRGMGISYQIQSNCSRQQQLPRGLSKCSSLASPTQDFWGPKRPFRFPMSNDGFPAHGGCRSGRQKSRRRRVVQVVAVVKVHQSSVNISGDIWRSLESGVINMRCLTTLAIPMRWTHKEHFGATEFVFHILNQIKLRIFLTIKVLVVSCVSFANWQGDCCKSYDAVPMLWPYQFPECGKQRCPSCWLSSENMCPKQQLFSGHRMVPVFHSGPHLLPASQL